MSRLAPALALTTALLAACATEAPSPPVLDPSTPMSTRHLNTSLECGDFQRNADGTWTSIHDVTLASPNGPVPVASGTSFREGSFFMGVDVAWALKQECGAPVH
jgi:hypothetical protein